MLSLIWNGEQMPEVIERCSCGAKFTLSDVDVSEALKAAKDWRRNHFCQVSEQSNDVGLISIDTSRNEVPFNPFTAGQPPVT